jgi:hypothetical protein
MCARRASQRAPASFEPGEQAGLDHLGAVFRARPMAAEAAVAPARPRGAASRASRWRSEDTSPIPAQNQQRVAAPGQHDQSAVLLGAYERVRRLMAAHRS